MQQPLSYSLISIILMHKNTDIYNFSSLSRVLKNVYPEVRTCYKTKRYILDFVSLS